MIQKFQFWVYAQNYWKQCLQEIFVLSSIIHKLKFGSNSSIHRQMNIHTMELISLKKEENSDICYTAVEPWGHYAKWNKPVTKEHILYDSTNLRYLETESILVVAKGWKKWSRVLHVWSFLIRQEFWRWMMEMIAK